MKRVLRILEYYGTDEKINDTLSRGQVPAIGTKIISSDLTIKSGLVGIGNDTADIHDGLDIKIDKIMKVIDSIYKNYDDVISEVREIEKIITG